jgi:hypothetical protein
MAQIVDWNKKWDLLQIHKYECNGPSKPLSPNLWKLLKNVWFLQSTIYLNFLKKELLEVLLKMKIIFQKWKSFFKNENHFLKMKKSSVCVFLMKKPQVLIFWNFFFDNSFEVFIFKICKSNWSFKFFMTWVIFKYKNWKDFVPLVIYHFIW